jgi:hypothetical protein
LALAAATPAHAGSFLVNATFDAVDANVGNGICATGTGHCTLRAAFQEAQANPDADFIGLDANTYFLTIDGTTEDLSATGDLDVSTDVTISFVEFGPATIDGDGVDRVIQIAPGGSLTATDLVIRDGGGNGGIFNSGTLDLTRVRITDNTSGSVAALHNEGTAVVSDSTIDNNVGGYGGGVVTTAGSLTLTNVTISGNRGAGGGLLSFDGTTTIHNSTLTANDGLGTFPGGIMVSGGTVVMANSIVADNVNSTGDCSSLDSAGYNLIGDATGCTITGDDTGNITGVSANLQALADNGGAVPTHAPNPGSIVIDAGNLWLVPGSGGNACTFADARNYPRVLGGVACDMGAFETGTCPLAPAGGCRSTQDTKAKLILRNSANDDRDVLVWKWLKGSLTTDVEYGTGASDYTMCVWNGDRLVASAVLPGGGSCAGSSCWTDLVTGLKYKDSALTPTGVLKAVFKEGADTRSKIVVRGKGRQLAFVPPPWVQPGGVTVQMQREGGVCWESTHTSSPTTNGSTGYKHTAGQ